MSEHQDSATSPPAHEASSPAPPPTTSAPTSPRPEPTHERPATPPPAPAPAPTPVAVVAEVSPDNNAKPVTISVVKPADKKEEAKEKEGEVKEKEEEAKEMKEDAKGKKEEASAAPPPPAASPASVIITEHVEPVKEAPLLPPSVPASAHAPTPAPAPPTKSATVVVTPTPPPAPVPTPAKVVVVPESSAPPKVVVVPEPAAAPIMTKADRKPSKLSTVQNVPVQEPAKVVEPMKVHEVTAHMLKSVPAVAEAIDVVEEDDTTQYRRRAGYRSRFYGYPGRLQKAIFSCMCSDNDRVIERHELPRKRDAFRATFFSGTALKFVLGRRSSAVVKPLIDDAATRPRGMAEHHTTHEIRAATRRLATKTHERRQKRHAHMAEMHAYMSQQPPVDTIHEMENRLHAEKAAYHAMKEVEHSEKHVRGRKRYVDEELHAAERHLAERRRRHESYLRARLDHHHARLRLSAKAAAVQTPSTVDQEPYEAYLREEQQKIEAQRQLNAEFEMLRAKKALRQERRRLAKAIVTSGQPSASANNRADEDRRAISAANIPYEDDMNITVSKNIVKPSADTDFAVGNSSKTAPQSEVMIRKDLEHVPIVNSHGRFDMDGTAPMPKQPIHFTNQSLDYVAPLPLHISTAISTQRREALEKSRKSHTDMCRTGSEFTNSRPASTHTRSSIGTTASDINRRIFLARAAQEQARAAEIELRELKRRTDLRLHELKKTKRQQKKKVRFTTRQPKRSKYISPSTTNFINSLAPSAIESSSSQGTPKPTWRVSMAKQTSARRKSGFDRFRECFGKS